MNGHLNFDELIDRLYGVGRNPHECAECEARLREMELRRARMTAPVEASSDVLAAQRRSIYARLGEKPRGMSWAPAAAGALCLAAAGVIVHHASTEPVRPAGHAAVAHARGAAHADPAADAQLFSDVYAMEQSVEPRAAAPLEALMEEN